MNEIYQEQVSELQSVKETPRLVSVTRSKQQAFRLKYECDVFTRYLIGQQPNSYVLSKYREAHKVSSICHQPETDAFDVLLLKVARVHPLATKFADTYASLFMKSSTVRRKAILLLAILESCAPTHAYFDTPDPGNKATFCLRMVQRGVIFCLTLLLSLVSLLPLQLAFALGSKLYSRGR